MKMKEIGGHVPGAPLGSFNAAHSRKRVAESEFSLNHLKNFANFANYASVNIIRLV